ncbi:MAG: FecR domain-containing protein [Gemmatimonadetes bacterium]|nr:FecR domain-containing protein [Gemmatimonadota bacterium]
MAGDGGAGKPKHHAHIKAADSGTPMKQMIIVGVIVALLGGGGLWWLNRAGEDNKLNTLFASNETRKISTVNGQRGDITLSDGTKLTIGSATKLVIIPKYNELYRGVKVDGTASFDVKASAGIPLEVRAGGAVFLISEGALVVRGYDDEGDVILKLTAGTGEIRAKGIRRQLTAPAAVHVSKDSTLTDADPAAADVATAWVDGKVVFKGLTLKQVLPLFEKNYAMKLTVKDEALLSRPVEMEAQLDSKQKAIAALEQSAHVKFTYDGSTPILKDDPAAAAKGAAKKK